MKKQRRNFVQQLGWGALGLLVPAIEMRAASPRRSWPEGDPFVLGVASGDPTADGFTIWARLAPVPLATDPDAPGGITGAPIAIDYVVAADETMRAVVRRGTVAATRDDAWSAHIDIAGLAPNRPYWYRFSSGDATSRTGRARTTAPAGARLDALKVGFVSCADYEHGYFSAYRHLADESPDVVLFLGDYIYEHAGASRPVRRHSDGVEATTLPLYRNRYAQYRMDPDLQRLHAETTALVTWDDHEVQNDYADRWSQNFDDPEVFLRRRAAAYRAFFEHMPVQAKRVVPGGASMRIYDRFAFGDLAEVSMIDGRQYRSQAACYQRSRKGRAHLETSAGCPELFDEERSMMGQAQEQWLNAGLAATKSRWNVIAQDVLMARLLRRTSRSEVAYWTDDWNGYPANRSRLLSHIDRVRPKNPIVLSGDIHTWWVNDLKLDFDDPGSRTVATEFVATSITSRRGRSEAFVPALTENPHVKFFEGTRHGYSTLNLSRRKATVAYRAISSVEEEGASVSTLATFVVENERPGAIAA